MSREVEAWAREQKTGDPVRKAVLMALGNYADPFGRNCYPSIPRVAEEVEVSVRTVQRHLKTLEDMGLVRRDPRLREDGSLSTNLFVFPTYTTPKLSHKEPPNRTGGGGANLTPGGDNLSPAGDAGGTGVVTMVSPQETPPESPPYAADKSAASPQGDLLLAGDGEREEEPPEPDEPKTRRGTRLPDNWTPPPPDTLPQTVQAVVKQWPKGAYEFAADGFAAYWTAESGRRATKRDWKAAWVKWLTGESARVMAMARSGIAFAAAVAERTDPAASVDVERLRQGEGQSARYLRELIKADVGERTYSGWWGPTAIGIDRDGSGWCVRVVAASGFAADWLDRNFLPTIQALARKVLESSDVLVNFEAVTER